MKFFLYSGTSAHHPFSFSGACLFQSRSHTLSYLPPEGGYENLVLIANGGLKLCEIWHGASRVFKVYAPECRLYIRDVDGNLLISDYNTFVNSVSKNVKLEEVAL